MMQIFRWAFTSPAVSGMPSFRVWRASVTILGGVSLIVAFLLTRCFCCGALGTEQILCRAWAVGVQAHFSVSVFPAGLDGLIKDDRNALMADCSRSR